MARVCPLSSIVSSFILCGTTGVGVSAFPCRRTPLLRRKRRSRTTHLRQCLGLRGARDRRRLHNGSHFQPGGKANGIGAAGSARPAPCSVRPPQMRYGEDNYLPCAVARGGVLMSAGGGSGRTGDQLQGATTTDGRRFQRIHRTRGSPQAVCQATGQGCTPAKAAGSARSSVLTLLAHGLRNLHGRPSHPRASCCFPRPRTCRAVPFLSS